MSKSFIVSELILKRKRPEKLILNPEEDEEEEEENDILKLFFLPDALYGSETWCLTPREGCIPKVFEYRLLQRIFEPKGEKLRRNIDT
jgi:hypothetical protein